MLFYSIRSRDFRFTAIPGIYIPASLYMIITTISFIPQLYKFYFSLMPEYGPRDIVDNIFNTDIYFSLKFSTVFYIIFVSGFVVAFIMLNLKTGREFLDRLFMFLSASLLIITGFGSYQFFIDPFWGNISYTVIGDNRQVNACMRDPNALGQYLAIVFPVFIGFLLYYIAKRKKAFIIISLAACFAILFLAAVSGSRISILSIVITIIIYSVIACERLIRKKVLKLEKPSFRSYLVSAIIVSSILILLFFLSISLLGIMELDENSPILLLRLQENVRHLSGEDPLYFILHGRINLWRQAVNMFLDHPFTGIGIGRYGPNLQDYNIRFLGREEWTDITPNNFYLHILAESGIFSLLFFIWFLAAVFIYSLHSLKKIVDKSSRLFYHSLVLSFSVFAVSFIVGSGLIYMEVQFIFYTVIGLLLNKWPVKDDGAGTRICREPGEQ